MDVVAWRTRLDRRNVILKLAQLRSIFLDEVIVVILETRVRFVSTGGWKGRGFPLQEGKDRVVKKGKRGRKDGGRGGGNKSRSNSKAVRNYRGPSQRSQRKETMNGGGKEGGRRGEWHKAFTAYK